MLNKDALVAAAKCQQISFCNYASQPIRIKSASFLSPAQANEVVSRYKKHGFAVIELESGTPTEESLLALGNALNLGDPFVPPLYKMGNYRAQKITKIASSADGADASVHPSFLEQIGLDLHCDGTLQRIGQIKTSVLLCCSASAEGGESILFNSSAAYAELVYSDFEAALALAHPDVFVRKANLNGCNDVNRGPTFAILNGELVCNYSITATDSWEIVSGVDKHVLKRGIKFMQSAATPGSSYYLQLKIAACQALIFANTKVSHGRMPYSDSKTQQRCMYRGIYTGSPSSNKYLSTTFDITTKSATT